MQPNQGQQLSASVTGHLGEPQAAAGTQVNVTRAWMTVVYWGALTVLVHAQDGREREGEKKKHTGKEKFGETLNFEI